MSNTFRKSRNETNDYVRADKPWRDKRDKKDRQKAPSDFKRSKERQRRSQRNQELKNLQAQNIEPDDIGAPKQPRTNDWDYT